jgi:DNA polymerase (family 10)
MTNKHEIAQLFDEIAILLELKGENPFKIRAYHNAARALDNLEKDLDLIIQEERLRDIPGIGAHLALAIMTLASTGHLPYYEELRKSLPAGLIELLKVPGIGGKKVKIFYEELGVKSIEDLLHACNKGEIAKLPHFGKKSQDNILNSIKRYQTSGQRLVWWEAMRLGQLVLQG